MMRDLHDLPEAVFRVLRKFTDDDENCKGDNHLWASIGFFLVSVFLFGGVLLTREIVLSTARKHFEGIRSSLRRARLP